MIIRPEAEADLVNARDWYERQRAGLGAAFLLCVEEVLDRIDRTPEIDVIVYQDVRRAFTRRFPYAARDPADLPTPSGRGAYHPRSQTPHWVCRGHRNL